MAKNTQAYGKTVSHSAKSALTLLFISAGLSLFSQQTPDYYIAVEEAPAQRIRNQKHVLELPGGIKPFGIFSNKFRHGHFACNVFILGTSLEHRTLKSMSWKRATSIFISI